MHEPAVALLGCPRCRGPLVVDSELRCGECKLSFPMLDGVPCLFADPSHTLGEWRNRYRLLLGSLEREIHSLASRLESGELNEKTIERLGNLKTAKETHLQQLQTLLAPLDMPQFEASYDTLLALQTRLPPDQGLTTYYNNAHRDWAWGEEENAVSAEIVSGQLGSSGPGPAALVLGAGAGRLAYDLHQAYPDCTTVALDFNPLLVLVLQRILVGDSVELTEFPIAPATLADVAVLRTLVAPDRPKPGLQPVIADALHPPFREGSFDTVVTPWLVDILPEDLSMLSRRINRLLKPEGSWILFGSLTFHHSDPALRYSLDECLEVVAETGFAVPNYEEREIPYMNSPASRHGRRERVISWRTQKLTEAEEPVDHRALPEWLVRDDVPVPLSSSFQSQAMSTRVYAFIMSLIDGRRSAADIAAVTVEQGLMSKEESGPTIRTFLLKMHEDSERQSKF
ncbi:MAG: methyltransferase domain-containing protein [Gammaproteobacteria bacterium]